jgi:hypothetical protein
MPFVLSIILFLLFSCNEVIAIITNISRHIDFMSTNLKYIKTEAVEVNKEIFAVDLNFCFSIALNYFNPLKFFQDEYLTLKFQSELNQAKENCKDLGKKIDSLSSVVDKVIGDFCLFAKSFYLFS